MTTIVQLSDLHLLSEAPEQKSLLDALVDALGRDIAARRRTVDLIVVTGDVFDTATAPPGEAIDAFCALHARLIRAVSSGSGRTCPTVIVPGNHDRRRTGLFAPHREQLFVALRDALGDRAYVHGCETPFLSAVVPADFHGIGAHVVAYDSTFLPQGLMSAGGLLRQEDLLRAACQIGDNKPEWPVLVLLHHHLVPTPLTDMGPIETHSSNALVRWSVQSLLPFLVANADREELTMTALGAGTALSTLHTLGRAVLVMHGHKHYATARMLDGVWQGEGDVMIVSAGSAGTAQLWNATSRDAARIWPSFSVVELDEPVVRVEQVSFSWKPGGTQIPVARPLIAAARRGARWDLRPVCATAAAIDDTDAPPLKRNVASFELASSMRHPSRWDYSCRRMVDRARGRSEQPYLEAIDGITDSVVRLGSLAELPVPQTLTLPYGEVTRFRVIGGLARTLDEPSRSHGELTSPYEWVGLLNRYTCELAELSVSGLGDLLDEAFASATDVGTGRETPLIARRDGPTLKVEMKGCPARTLLRVYWPLRRGRRAVGAAQASSLRSSKDHVSTPIRSSNE